MSYRIRPHKNVEKSIQKVVCQQIDRALDEVTTDKLNCHEIVHQVRKRCKKVRAVLRLVRPHFAADYAVENASFRDAARLLSEVRDAQAMLETYDQLLHVFASQVERRTFAPLRRALTLRRKRIVEASNLGERLAEFLSHMRDARERAATWSLSAKGFEAMAAALTKTHRRARKAMRRVFASPTDAQLHDWRKRVKYHMYHGRLLQPLWPPMFDAYIGEMQQLADFLGEDHNLAVMRHLFLTSPEEFGRPQTIQTLLALLEQRRRQLQGQAQALGERLFAEKSSALTIRWQHYWDAWQAERKRSQSNMVIETLQA